MKTKTKQRLQAWLDAHVPMGIDGKKEFNYIVAAMLVNLLYSMVSYLYILDEAYSTIFINEPIMADLKDLLDYPMIGFYVLAIAALGLAVQHYRFHFQSSKSIYLMKRLPDQKDLMRRCLSLPLLMLFLCIITALALVCIDYLIYLAWTPEQYLSPNQWQKLWTF